GEGDGMAIIGGDFGLDPKAAPLDELRRAGFRDAWASAGSGLGYTEPAARPRQRLHYIWLNERSGGLRVANILVFNAPGAGASLPLVADFIRQPAPPPLAPEDAPPAPADELDSSAEEPAPDR